MLEIVFPVFLTAFVGSTLLLKNTENALDQCLFQEDEFWLIYEIHFLLSSSLRVRVLQSDNHKFEIDQFTQRVIQKMNSYDYQITTEVQEIFLNESSGSNRSDDNTACPKSSKTDGPSYPDPALVLEQLFRAKMWNSDSINGYVVIVWNVEKLHRFLNRNYLDVIPEARATYALVFVSSSAEDELASILRRFWIDYNVVNVIAQIPCSCDNTQVFIYRPFVKVGGSWGFMEQYSINQVVNNFTLIINPLTDFNGFPLKVAAFENAPFALEKLPKMLETSLIYKNLSSSKGFASVDGMLFGTLVEYFNFNPILVATEDKDPFGIALPNGTTTGSLGDVVNRKAIYSINGRFMANYFTSEIEFATSYTSDQACIMAPKASKIPKWKTIFYAFDEVTWCFIGVTYVTCVTAWYIIGPSRNLPKVIWEMYLYLVGVPVRMTPTPSQFLFLTSCMLFSLKILGVLQGSLFNAFTLTTYYRDINTLEEVDEAEMPIASNIWNLINDESELMKRLKRKGTEIDENIFDLVAYKRNVMYLETKSYLEVLIKTKYIDDDGLPLLHIVEECVTTFFISNIVPRGSAFLTVFNNVITRSFESGLTKKWYYDVIDAMVAEKLFSLGKKHKSAKSFSLWDVQSAFLVLLLGYVFSLIGFLSEIVMKKKIQKL